MKNLFANPQRNTEDDDVSDTMWTTNFQMFKFHKFNRPAHDCTIVREELERKGFWRKLHPLTCNQHHEILNGQNRFLLAQELGFKGLHYQVIKTRNEEHDLEIIDSFKTGSPWNLTDELRSNKAIGRKSSEQFLEFASNNHLPVSIGLRLFTKTGNLKQVRQTILKHREFEVHPEAEQFTQYVLRFSDLPFNRKSAFITALRNFYFKASKQQRDKLYVKRMALTHFGNHKLFENAICNIVNSGVPASRHLHL